MRGRNLDRAFIILDEGQNCTRKQMQMFLTRLGASSKSVVTGDISQTDLPPDTSLPEWSRPWGCCATSRASGSSP